MAERGEGVRTCPTHGLALVEEPGGPDKPTIHGRTYCPTCQEELTAALDEDLDKRIMGPIRKA